MPETRLIHIDDYRYTLPEERIAKYPLSDRNRSKLLYYSGGEVSHYSFNDLPELLEESSNLVFNNTRVIQARMEFRKSTGAQIEIFCLEPVDPAEYEQSFLSVEKCMWSCLVGNAKKWKEGPVYLTTSVNGSQVSLLARKIKQDRDSFIIEFSWDNRECSFGQIIENAGYTPIPPYLNRHSEELDKLRYQTIYCRHPGSVAAPTAGLHFTDEMLNRLNKLGMQSEELTLHVGAGTFVPVKESNGRKHKMHAEHVSIPLSFLEKWSSDAVRKIAVGTTSTRSLESLYWLGVKLLMGEKPDPFRINMPQWQYETLSHDISLKESLQTLVEFCRINNLSHLQFSTQLMIVPGYSFRTIKGLITNFHMPGSTLLLLIAALVGKDWRKIYDEALKNQYRFLSYGDSSLLLP